MFSKRNLVPALCLTGLLISALSCNLLSHIPIAQTEKPKTTATLAPVTQDTIQPVQTQVSSAIETATSDGSIKLEFTEDQINQLASQELSDYQQVKNLHITLGSGTIQISGNVSQTGFSLPMTINLKVIVDSQGRPHAEIMSGKAGPFALQQSVIDEISAQVDSLIQDEIDASGNDLFVDSVVIENGKLTISAHVKTS